MSRPPSPPPSPFGGLNSRFGASKVNFSLAPVTDTLVLFELSDLGDPLYRFLNMKRRRDVTDLDAVCDLLKADTHAAEQAAQKLTTAWAEIDLRGAILLYSWRDDVRQSVMAEANAEKSKLMLLRAREPKFVLNVLARARANLLLHDTPLELERSFLERCFVTDDPRMVVIAQKTGYLRENLPASADETSDTAGRLRGK